MENNIFNLKGKKIHFIGIGGVSMSGISLHLKSLGFEVSGSDILLNSTLKMLKNSQIRVFVGHSESAVKGADAVVFCSAIDENNPEILMAKKLKIPIFKRSQILGQILTKYKNSIAVSGCHGKTTTTAMISCAIEQNNLSPTVFVGGTYNSIVNYKRGESDIAVVEACEFRKNFLDLSPKYAVVLNIDNDHLDCYKDIKDLVKTFSQFIKDRIAIINADDEHAKNILNSTSITFGIYNRANFMAKNVKFNGKGYSFTVYAYSMRLGRINLKVLGYHNIYNALATIALAQTLNLSFSKTKQALENFSGVDRRQEFIGNLENLACFCDYAHHPKEIESTLDAFNGLNCPYITVFQPHTYSRTKLLMADFINALKGVNDLVIYKTYPAREKVDILGDGKTLFDNLKKVSNNKIYYASTENELKDLIYLLKEKYNKILFLGAGNIYDIAKKIVEDNNG